MILPFMLISLTAIVLGSILISTGITGFGALLIAMGLLVSIWADKD